MPLVIASGTFGLASAGDQTIYTHNLGYVPIAFPLVNGYWASGGDNGTCDWDCSTLQDDGSIFIDDTKIWYKSNSFGSGKNVTYLVLGVDLETDITYQNIDTVDDAIGTINNNYGFKVSKITKDVLTAGLADLASFSGTSSFGTSVRHQIIHSVGGYENLTSGSTLTIAHNLGYKPMFLFYVDSGVDGFFIEQISYRVEADATLTITNRCYADNTNIYFVNNSGGTWSLRYVIFKDPLL